MKKLLTLIIALFALQAGAQTLYTRAFGNKNNKAVIFLHGGPGYNCANFEGTTARSLADKGFYVIVYDRRGEGRSLDSTAKYTFEETFSDLKTIYKQYGIRQASLIGHSFGGIVAVLFAEKYPKYVSSVVLVGAPVSLQQSFRTIIRSSKAIYQARNDTTNLMYIGMIEKMDTASIPYASYCFGHAMQNGFYTPEKISEEAMSLYTCLKNDSVGKYAMQMSYQAPQGFWTNEQYTTLDLTKNVKHLVAAKTKLYALYGKEDGLYSPQQVNDLQQLIGDANLLYIDNCSHNVFVDQQSVFLEKVKDWAK